MLKLPKLDSIILDLSEKVSLPECGGVYALYSKEGYLIYVGKTNSFRTRMYYHLSETYKKFISRIELFRIDNELDMDIYETYFINTWKPIMNVSKAITYQPITRNPKIFEKFDSVESIVKHFNPPIIRKINRVSNEKNFNKEMTFLIKSILKEQIFIEKSDLRRMLDSRGFNVNLIMTKAEFDDFLKSEGFNVSKRLVRRGEEIAN